MISQRQIRWGIGLTGLIGIGAVGCGVSSHFTATPTHSSTAHVTGTVHTSGGSPSPSPSASPTTTPAVATASATTPSSMVSTTSSPYNPVVVQALAWAHTRTGVALGAPTWLPTMPSASGRYLSATATATASGWAVTLDGTAQPYGINNPAIAQTASTHPWVSFGTQTLSADQLASARLSLLEAYSQMGPSHPKVTTGPSQTVALGDGISGTFYANGTMLWHEGDWTLAVQATSGEADVTAIAKPLVAYLHTACLPPHPGFVDVFQNTASVDWLVGHQLVSIQGGPEPALDVLHMAVTWRSQSS